MWKLVLDHSTGQYAAGFDSTQEYEFKRAGRDELRRYRMSEQSQYFNIAGLYYRALPPDSRGGR